jgi:enterobacterial common antigen flippase
VHESKTGLSTAFGVPHRVNQETNHSYRQILRSSALIGGSSLISILAGILRTKAVAVFLGPAGIGLMGLFGSMTGLVGAVTGMGITTSGVRHIADAAGADEEIRIARTVTAVRQIVLRLGLVGSALLAIFCVPVSRVTFGTADHASTIAVLSLVIVVGAVADGQLTLLQGFRRIGDLARVAVLGTTISLILTLPIVYFWREQAIAALLLMASGAGLASSWWYARRIKVAPVSMKWRETLNVGRPLLRLGLAAMSTALMVAAVAYVVRVVIVRYLGFEAAGMYQSATALSSVYCGFILSAMGADFLPRVSSIARDDAECNRLVNEQAEVGLLLAFPGICATIAFAPLIVQFLYSGQFGLATEVLRWQVLGVFLRVASWPMGYLLLAKGKAKLYFWTELSYNALHATLIWICVQRWGLTGTGIAFFGLYVYYLLLMYVVLHTLSGFAWSAPNRRFALKAIPTTAFVFVCPMILPSPWHFIVAGATTSLAGWYSLRTLLSLAARQGLQESFSDQILVLRAAGLRAAGFLRVKHG